MTETNIRIVEPGVGLKLEVRICELTGQDLAPKTFERACDILRSRGLAASGAKVRPVRRVVLAMSARSTEKLSSRSEGRLTVTLFSAAICAVRSTSTRRYPASRSVTRPPVPRAAHGSHVAAVAAKSLVGLHTAVHRSSASSMDAVRRKLRAGVAPYPASAGSAG